MHLAAAFDDEVTAGIYGKRIRSCSLLSKRSSSRRAVIGESQFAKVIERDAHDLQLLLHFLEWFQITNTTRAETSRLTTHETTSPQQLTKRVLEPVEPRPRVLALDRLDLECLLLTDRPRVGIFHHSLNL